MGGKGESPKFIFHRNTPIFVTWEPMQKFIGLAAFFMVEKQWPQKIGVILPVDWGYISGRLGLYCRLIGVIFPVDWGYMAK